MLEIWDAAREMDDKVRGLEADYEQAELDGKKGLSFFRNIVCGWGAGKLEEDRMYWGAVCNEVICRRSMYANQDNAGDSKRRPSTGSILMHAFPQQFVTAVAAATDGKEILVDAWKQNWHVTVNIETLAHYQG